MILNYVAQGDNNDNTETEKNKQNHRAQCVTQTYNTQTMCKQNLFNRT